MSRIYISPSRTYVAMCHKADFKGVYFKKFTLPEVYDGPMEWPCDPPASPRQKLPNHSDVAAWYFLNRLNAVACIETIITWEDYSSLSDQKE